MDYSEYKLITAGLSDHIGLSPLHNRGCSGLWIGVAEACPPPEYTSHHAPPHHGDSLLPQSPSQVPLSIPGAPSLHSFVFLFKSHFIRKAFPMTCRSPSPPPEPCLVLLLSVA